MSADRYLPTTGAHWATEFRAMIGHVGIDARVNPWSHSPGRDYREGFMGESLAVLRRIALAQTNPRLAPGHCEAIPTPRADAAPEGADKCSTHRPERGDSASQRAAEALGGQ